MGSRKRSATAHFALFHVVMILPLCSCASYWEEQERRWLSFWSMTQVLRIERPAEGVVVIYFAMDDGTTTLVGYVEDRGGPRYARLWIDDWIQADYRPDQSPSCAIPRPKTWRIEPASTEGQVGVGGIGPREHGMGSGCGGAICTHHSHV